MQIGASLFMLAVGAILSFAVTASFAGIDLVVVGYILMAVGGLGLILSLVMLTQNNERRDPPQQPRG